MKKLLYLSFLFLGFFAFGQERTVFGNVTSSEDGLPLPGATVMIKNTTRGTIADFDGNYSLIAAPSDTLAFSFIAHKTQEIRADKEEINVIMEDDGIIIEVVYGPAHYPPRIQPVREKVFTVDKNPKRAFKKNAKNNTYVIFISELIYYSDFSENEVNFQQEYNIKYASNSDFSIQYLKKYNKLTFKHLNKKYNTDWQNEIRKDAIGLDEYLDE